jgi:hypothetical protein
MFTSVIVFESQFGGIGHLAGLRPLKQRTLASTVSQILRARSLDTTVWSISWTDPPIQIRQRENGFRHKFERYIARDRDNPDLRRKAMTAITAKMARVVHAVIKSGSDYRPSSRGGCQVEGPLSAEP